MSTEPQIVINPFNPFQFNPDRHFYYKVVLDYPTYRDNEIKAFAEFLIDTGFRFESLIYHGANATYTQACIRMIDR